MALTREQQEFLAHNFNERHAKYGKTALAAQEAWLKMITLSTHAFAAIDNAQWRGELALQTVTLSLAAAKKAQTAEEIKTNLSRAILTVFSTFPVGTQQEEVEKRNAYWDAVFEDAYTAQLRCLRDLTVLMDFVSVFSEVPELQQLSQTILAELFARIEEFPDTSALHILSIERGTLPEARKAIVSFFREKGVFSLRHNRAELKAVVAKFLKNSLDHNGIESHIGKLLASVSGKFKTLWQHVESVKSHANALSHIEALHLIDPEVTLYHEAHVEGLLEIQYIGLGGGKIVQVPKRE